MEFFQIDKNTKFLIYSIGGDGIKIFKTLTKNGLEVLGFIDKRANDVPELLGKKVWLLENIPDCKEAVVFIAVKNVFIHNELSNNLIDLGYYKQIYTPPSVISGNQNDFDLDIYNIFHKHRKGDVVMNTDIKLTNKKHKTILKDTMKINSDNKLVTCYLPVELLFNYEIKYILEDVNMMGFYHMTELYEFFNNNNTNNEAIDNYISYSLNWVVKSDVPNNESFIESFIKRVIESKYEVYKNMLDKFQFQFDFFIEFAPEVEMKSPSHFNIINSGRNRVSFLIAMGYEAVPVKMKLADYEKFSSLNNVQTSQIEEVTDGLFSRIPHPFLYQLNYNATRYSSKFLRYVLTTIYKQNNKLSEIVFKDNLVTLDNEKSKENLSKHNLGIMVHDSGETFRFFKNIPLNLLSFKSENMTDLNDNRHKVFNEIFGVTDEYSDTDCVLLNSLIISHENSFYENVNLIKKCTENIFILSCEGDKILTEITTLGFNLNSTFYNYFDYSLNKSVFGYHFKK